jgi:hypothetical protein
MAAAYLPSLLPFLNNDTSGRHQISTLIKTSHPQETQRRTASPDCPPAEL